MAYVISDDCISCGTCEGECPAGAISEGDGKYEIDADTCMDCGSCAGACPAGALHPEQGADLFRRGGRGRVSGAGGRAHFEAHQPVEAAGGALRPAGGGVHLRARAFSGRGV